MTSVCVRTFSRLCRNYGRKSKYFPEVSFLRISGLRLFNTSSFLCNGSITMTLIMSNGARHKIKGNPGDSLLDSVKNSGVDIDNFGVCDGGAACSTCHLIFKAEDYNKLPDMEDIEADVLELTSDHLNLSRLACQVMVIPELDGIEIHVPSHRFDIRESGSSSVQTDS